jgi:hypothetical protein
MVVGTFHWNNLMTHHSPQILIVALMQLIRVITTRRGWWTVIMMTFDLMMTLRRGTISKYIVE